MYIEVKSYYFIKILLFVTIEKGKMHLKDCIYSDYVCLFYIFLFKRIYVSVQIMYCVL